MMPPDTFAAPLQRQLTPKEPQVTKRGFDDRASISESDGESSADEARTDSQSRKRKRSMKISYATIEQ